ncbi:AAA family ATPase [Demequina pelophila]|uniref:AAA family ATPase n=1 Tax=Demequina pelophila TaxID=1638984 RepID=UPI0007860398|nr:hypothetical protein [Demequina pelophila]
MPRVGVIVAVRGEHETQVVAQVEAHRDLTVVRRCADLAEAVAVARAGLGSVLVLSEHPRLDREVVRDIVAAGVAPVGVASAAGGESVLVAAGVAVVEDLARVADAVVRASASPPGAAGPGSAGPGAVASGDDGVGPAATSEPSRDGRIVAVWGCPGAPGRTTVAIGLAAELAAAGTPALLVDLDTHAASVSLALGLTDESPGVAAVARGAVRGEDVPALVSRHAVRLAPHLSVLTGLARASRWPELSATALAELWPALRASAEVTVVDLAAPLEQHAGAHAADTPRNAATIAALEEADAVVVVGGAEPHLLVRLVEALLEAGLREPTVVVNRVRASIAGARPEDAIADVLGRHADVAEVWPLPWDPRATDAALRDGRTLVEAAPRSPLRRALQSLAPAVAQAARGRADGAAREGRVPVPAVTD